MAIVVSGGATALAEAMENHRQGNIPVAEAGYRQVLMREPGNVDALHLLGLITAQRGDAAGGAVLIEQALARNPKMAEAHFNLGNILLRLEQLDGAESHFRDAARLQPNNVEAVANLGATLFRRENNSEAERALRTALRLNPGHVSALANLGALLELTDRPEDTLTYYNEALARRPDDAQLHNQKAGALLIRGQFHAGWPEYTWRFRRPQSPGFFGRFPFPHWQGEPLAGRHILIWTEQGLGDEILAASMIDGVMAQGAHVTLVCSPRLETLFRRAFPSAALIAADGKPKDPALLSNIAFQASVSDLGAQLRASFEAFPQNAYLRADPALVETLRARYRTPSTPERLVGISWRSKSPEAEAEKSIPLVHWKAVLQTPGVKFINLQYGNSAEEATQAAAAFGVQIATDPRVNSAGDLDVFAAQVAAMDLTISVSNTTVHVAGAMGRPVWALIPSNRGRLWYWFLERRDSPWYPLARLFRKPVGGSWAEALEDVATELSIWTKS